MTSASRAFVVAAALAATRCATDTGCLDGRADCVVPSPCPELAFQCDAGTVDVRFITDPSEVPGGVAALGAVGDVLLSNDRVVAVIDALDHPHYLAPTGGMLLDLATVGGDDDSLRQLLHASGLLPEDAFHYTDLKLISEDGLAAVQVTGTLDGRPGVRVATRYEVRPCEPGVRVRTELLNGGPDALSILLADAVYYGDRQAIPFTPYPGAGFDHPSFGLTTVTDVLREVPFMATGGHPDPAASYGIVACDRPTIQGFHSGIVSAIGPTTRVFLPRDYETYERFVAVAHGPSVAGPADVALEVRRQLFGEPWVRLTGSVTTADGDPGRSDRVQIIVSEGTPGDDPTTRTPWTHVVPDFDGSWFARVPAGRTYTVEVSDFGARVAEVQVDVGDADASVDPVQIPRAGELVISGTVDGVTDQQLVFLRPSTQAQEDAQVARFLGNFEACAPLLGHPHGDAPACDRVLVQGTRRVVVPPGTYDLYTVAGPFSTLGQALDVTVDDGQSVAVQLDVTTLPLQPEGTLSADFHVHGGPSFDASIGDIDRVRTFLAAHIDVVASTEHDVVASYAAALRALNGTNRMHVITGTESTGHILFPLFEDAAFPKVIGHWNFWPVPYDAGGPYRGAAWDEKAEPGVLMDRMVAQGWDRERGVAQLNHPWGGFQFGRDYAWPQALELDLTAPLPTAYDGSGASLFLRTPDGASFSNADYQVQEVMNGSANAVYTDYRAFWFYLLGQGIVRGGTANSDTHSLLENVLGFPRNLVSTSTTVGTFDEEAFDAAVRDGRIVGTNGPVIVATVADADGTLRGPSRTPFAPDPAGTLRITVSAAPWVPVDEVRVVVNGEVVRTVDGLPTPDPLGTTGLVRLDTGVPLSEILPASGDAWIVVEAGHALVPSADLDCNGWPDTGDTNGDGTIDWRDVDGLTEDPGTDCLDDVGPLGEPAVPERGAPGHAFSVVVPGGAPSAFTNPFVLDRDGDGKLGVTR